MSIIDIIVILLVHWFTDFVLQSNNQATKKSQSNKPWNYFLAEHCFVYSSVSTMIYFYYFYWQGYVIEGDLNVLFIFPYLYITHYITDWVTSRWSKSYFDENNYHNGFVVIGFDQILHYLTLLLMFLFFKNGI